MSPYKPKKPCSYPGCPALTDGGRCELHKRKAWEGNKQELRVLKGRTLQGARDRLFNESPLCAECLKVGRDTAATIRDHVIPLAQGGRDTDDNTQSLCKDCHNKKTQQEARQGRCTMNTSGS
jgi:5-methylcytosine-specific restriction protein A